jgi:hypothetical protein
MRYAWLRENSADDVAIKQANPHPLSLIKTAYNAAFWIFLLPFFTRIAYSTGFVAFTALVLLRLGMNLYMNNVLKLEPDQFERFPFRT